MSLSLALLGLLSPAFAGGTAVWLAGVPDPSVTPGLEALPVEQIAPSAAWSAADQQAVDHLAAELAATWPLREELDGELQIMRRLDTALAAVDLVREQDRDLVYRALVFQGYAVHRYFQDTLASDESAAPWRVEDLGRVAVRPWVQAVALDPDRVPTLAELPDEPQLAAYTELRAAHLLVPTATVEIAHLPAGGALLVDGRRAPGARHQVAPGRHDLALVQGDHIVLRDQVELESGGSTTVAFQAPASTLVGLAPGLAEAEGAVLLDPAVVARLASLPGPVELVVEGRKGPRRFTVSGTSALPVGEAAPAGRRTAGSFVLSGALGGAWIYDGNYLIQNLDAPETVGTVNAGAPTGTVRVGGELGPVAVGAGVDLALPLGDHHDLPVGEQRMRLRAFPHLAVGHRLVQVAAGPLLPWHVGVGPRLHLPLPDLGRGPVELVAAYTHGIGLTLLEADGETDFSPGAARMAWVGVGGRWQTGR